MNAVITRGNASNEYPESRRVRRVSVRTGRGRSVAVDEATAGALPEGSGIADMREVCVMSTTLGG